MSIENHLNKCLKTTYALTQCRNLDKFLCQIGVAKETRRRAINLKPTIQLTKKNENYILITNYGRGIVNKITFEFDKSIVRKLKHNDEIVSTFVAKDGKIEETIFISERTITVTRTFTTDPVIVTMMTENERCERFYKKVYKPDVTDVESETSRRTATSSGSSSTSEGTFDIKSENEMRNIN